MYEKISPSKKKKGGGGVKKSCKPTHNRVQNAFLFFPFGGTPDN